MLPEAATAGPADRPVLQHVKSQVKCLKGILREVLEPYRESIELAYIFGSHAEGTERPDSDVDLMVVGLTTRRELSTAIRRTERVLRRDINAMFYQPAEYGEALQDSNSFVSRVHHGKRIDLHVDSGHEPAGHGVER